MTHRDRQGRQIELTEWADLFDDLAYRIVAEDQVEGVRIRTVWEGIDELPGAMFATGVLPQGEVRWSNERADARTEAEAMEQHRKVVQGVRRRSGSIR
ncbi:hypothetical protein ABT160_42385 [Streptomyces sp. NPDC001941]|uniref:hypothetical protein n=1 Tax=Streptomyces sp. NPDC001941 TaxID=3154659 RepID=UPI00331E8FAA